MWGSDPSLLGGNFCNCDYPPLCGLLTRVVGLDYTVFPPLLLVSLLFLLYIFCCRKSFLLEFRSFSLIVTL